MIATIALAAVLAYLTRIEWRVHRPARTTVEEMQG